MLYPARYLIDGIRAELRALTQHDPEIVEASPTKILRETVKLLAVREEGGPRFVQNQIERLDATLRTLEAELQAQSAPSDLVGELTELRRKLAAVRREESLDRLEAAWPQIVADFSDLIDHLNGATTLSPTSRTQLAQLTGAWEVGDLIAQTTTETTDTEQAHDTVTRDKLALYLRDRFKDPNLIVTGFNPLLGGFGKQTYLFDVTSESLNGAFVMRRDMAEPLCDNDCHRVRLEFPVIRTAFERGFPAPDAVWLDTEHELLPGGDFIVMRKSPGRFGGNVFGAEGKLAPELVRTLADILGRLHSLQPLRELGNLTEMIRTDLWDLSVSDCIYRYMRHWYDFYRGQQHTPSPAIMSLFGWLLDNIPAAEGRPVLLHGDMTLANILLENGALTAVLDWEFAHIGDPAEEIGYVRNTIGHQLDWPQFMALYKQSGGADIDPVRLRYFQVWGYVRNACASNLASSRFADGRLKDLKLAYTGYFHLPLFIRAACDLIAAPI